MPVFIFRSMSWSFLGEGRSWPFPPFRGTGLELCLCPRVSPRKVLVTSLVLCLVNIFGRFFFFPCSPPFLSTPVKPPSQIPPRLSCIFHPQCHISLEIVVNRTGKGKAERDNFSESCYLFPRLREPGEKGGDGPQLHNKGSHAC